MKFSTCFSTASALFLQAAQPPQSSLQQLWVGTILFFFLLGCVSPSISSRKVSSVQIQFALAKLYVVATKFNTVKADRSYINSGYAGSTCALYKVSYQYLSADSSPIRKSISKSNVNAYFCCNPYIISLNMIYR